MHSVTIYTSPTCMYCRQAKDFFREHGVPYKEADVLSDLSARQYMMQKSGQKKVPVFEIGGEMLVGFTENKDTLLARVRANA